MEDRARGGEPQRAPVGRRDVVDLEKEVGPFPGDSPDGEAFEGDLSELTARYSGPSRGELMELEIAAEDGELVAREVGSEDDEESVRRYVSGLTWTDGGDRYRFVRAGDRIVELRLDVVGGRYPIRKIGRR